MSIYTKKILYKSKIYNNWRAIEERFCYNRKYQSVIRVFCSIVEMIYITVCAEAIGRKETL